jgi:hypothetical protein
MKSVLEFNGLHSAHDLGTARITAISIASGVGALGWSSSKALMNSISEVSCLLLESE